MRRTRPLLAVLLVYALISIGVPIGHLAAAAAQESAGVGIAVPVSNAEGVPVGSITVTEVSDPFTAFNPDYPAEAGSRYVVASVAFDADAGQRFDIAPSSVVLQDDAGFLWNRSGLTLPDDALVPELSSQTLAPGSRVTGLVGFVVPEGRAPARIFFQPTSSQIVLLADLLGTPAPGIGDAVSVPDSQGGMGSVTVADVVDPFTDVDPSQAPPEGTRFVLISLVYQNPGDGRFFIEPYGLLLRDANGDLWNATSITRPAESEIVPDLTSAQLAPGDRLSGVVIFAVPDGAGVAGIYDSPESGQLLQLAQVQGAASGAATPAAANVTEGQTASAGAVDEDACAVMETWLANTRERIARAAEMSVQDATLEDLDSLSDHVAEYEALAEAQLAEDAPAAGAAANKALAATLNAYSGAIDQILHADDPGKETVAEVTEGMNTFNDAGARMHDIEGELAKIASTCGLS